MEVLMGNSSINSAFSIALFDYRRVDAIRTSADVNYYEMMLKQICPISQYVRLVGLTLSLSLSPSIYIYIYICICMRVCIYIYIYTMYIYICTYIPLKSKDLALEGLSPRTCFSNKRHHKDSKKVYLAYASKRTIFCPTGLQTGTRCSYMRQHVFFPSVCPGSPRTSILWQKGNMNVHTYFQGFEHDPTSTQQAILYILFKNFWYQCWTHNNFQFGIFDPRVHDFFVSFHDFFVSFHDFLMSFHGLSTVCPRVGPSQKKLCFVFVPQTVHMSRRKNRSAEEKIYFNPWNHEWILMGS